MILLIEPNRSIRKRLCDLLSRERILGVGTYNESLEMLAKFRNQISIIIANIRVLKEILLRGTLMRLCQRLYIEVPPIMGIYRRGDEQIKQEFEENKIVGALVHYDGEDNSFPERYIDAVRILYPDVIAEMKTAHENWLKGDTPAAPIDVQTWLEKEGFVEAIEGSKLGKVAKDMESILPLIKKMIAATETEPQKKKDVQQDYEKMYIILKKKYDLLVQYVKELARSTKNTK